MSIRCFAIAVAALLTASCAIHPEPEDVTGVSTAHIVRQIRCETRDAARALILRQLERLAVYSNNPTAQELLTKYTANPESMSRFDPNKSFSAPSDLMLRNVFNLIYSGGVAYSFTLTMNEQNDLAGGAGFLGSFANRFTLGLTANVNRSRENERTFTVTDKIGYLLRELNTPDPQTGSLYCDGHIASGPDYMYPIAGKIGIYKTVYTFFQMTIFDGLAPKPGSSAGSTPAMADKLTFTTLLDLSAKPSVVFAPVPTTLQVTDVSGTGLARRKDTHQVIVGLALEPTGPVFVSSLRGFVFSGEEISRTPFAPSRRRGRDQIVVGNRVTASTTSAAEALAVQQIDQVKSRELQLIPPPNQ
ncbi:hypothetical protein AFFFEF_04800 [Methylorubrum extorquens]